MHWEMVVAAAEAGKHVLCEKPMCNSVDEADRMIEACREAGVVLVVGFTDSAVMTCLFENGALATLYESFAYPWPHPHGVDRSLGGGGRSTASAFRDEPSIIPDFPKSGILFGPFPSRSPVRLGFDTLLCGPPATLRGSGTSH